MLLSKNAIIALAVAVVLGLLALWVNNYIEVVREEGRKEGIASENKRWSEKYDKDVATLNLRIQGLEADAKSVMTASLEAQRKADATVDALRQQVSILSAKYNQAVFDKAGVKVCTMPEGNEVYLGHDFATQWNALSAVTLQ